MRLLAKFLAVVAGCLVVSACGYHLGGTKPAVIEHAKTIAVDLFENTSLEPRAATLVTSSLAEQLQSDGTLQLVSRSVADLKVRGRVRSVRLAQWRSASQDTYSTLEYGLSVDVDYEVIDAKTNKVLLKGQATESTGLFSTGNLQTAKTNALSYAARRLAAQIAERIVNG